jgi:thiol:disulfide interchange protein
MFLRLLSCFFGFYLSFSSLSLAAENAFFSSNAAEQTEEFLTVEQAYQADLLFNNGQWFVVWQLADQYFLYRHGFKHEWLLDGKVTTVETVIPDGIVKMDEYFGKVEIYYQQVMLPLAPPDGNKTLFFKATSQGCADAGLCYPPYSLYFSVDPVNHVSTPVSAETYNAALVKPAPAIIKNPATESSLAWILLSALLGGLILNLMPCVLPVLSIKVMQFARHPDSASARQESLMYLAGVISSFVTIAALMLALRASGSAIGWGFQLQNPWFIAGLVYLFFILGLSMSGVINFGHRWMGMGQSLTDKGGLSGAFFTGVLAVVVASPCTAPFMSAALGYAVTQPAYIALLVFATLGLGMALPLTLISFIPAARKWLPKPGLWMEQLKQFFAFPLYATAIWLLWVFGNQTGTLGMMALLFGCLAIVIAFWYFQNATVISKIIGCLALIAAFTLPFSMEWQKQAKPLAAGHEVYSQANLANLRQQRKPVFVDLTADWCITCIANEKSTLETPEIQQAFKDAGIVYMVGDWTDYNPEINQLLADYGRSGIPLYLLFPADPDSPALILPQLLNSSIVLEYINKIDSER